jgi:hypothetical protein
MIYANTSKQEKLFLRVYEELQEKEEKNSSNFFDIPIKIKDDNWYINLPHKKACYYIKIILFMYGEEKILCTSNVITSPAKTIEDANTDYALTNEDMLLLAGFYKFDEETSQTNTIPQRIISFTDDKYLNDNNSEEKSGEV